MAYTKVCGIWSIEYGLTFSFKILIMEQTSNPPKLRSVRASFQLPRSRFPLPSPNNYKLSTINYMRFPARKRRRASYGSE